MQDFHFPFFPKLVFWGYITMILLLVTLPINGMERTLTHTYVWRFRLDQLLHVILFSPWVAACISFIGKFRLFTALLLGLVAAFCFEGLQYLLPYRSFNINDLAANWAGILLGGFPFLWPPLRLKLLRFLCPYDVK